MSPAPRPKWSDEEEARLAALYGTGSASQLAAEFPGRSPEAITMKAWAMGLTGRTEASQPRSHSPERRRLYGWHKHRWSDYG